MPRKPIIDTDPGIDDATAIYLALASPELEVVGLTTVFGNLEVELGTTNALRLLEIAAAAAKISRSGLRCSPRSLCAAG